MESPCPSYVLIHSSEAVMDLYFWDTKFLPHKHQSNTADSAGIAPNDVLQVQANHFLIAGYGNNGGVDLWSLITRRVLKSFSSEHGVLSVFGTQQGEILYLNKEGDLRLFNIDSVAPKLSLQISNVAFCKMSCLNDENRLLCGVTGQEESSICVWDLRKKKVLSNLFLNDGIKLGMVMSIKIFEKENDNVLCLGAYEAGWLILWDVERESDLHRLEMFKMEPIMCFDFAAAQMSGVAGSPSESLKKFSISEDAQGQLHLQLVKLKAMTNPGISDVKIRRDCKIVVAGGWHDGSVRVFSFKSLKPLAMLTYHSGTVQSIAFCNDSLSSRQILASGSMTNKIAIWKIYND